MSSTVAVMVNLSQNARSRLSKIEIARISRHVGCLLGCHPSTSQKFGFLIRVRRAPAGVD